MACPRCGGPLQGGDVFCGTCGAPVEQGGVATGTERTPAAPPAEVPPTEARPAEGPAVDVPRAEIPSAEGARAARHPYGSDPSSGERLYAKLVALCVVGALFGLGGMYFYAGTALGGGAPEAGPALLLFLYLLTGQLAAVLGGHALAGRERSGQGVVATLTAVFLVLSGVLLVTVPALDLGSPGLAMGLLVAGGMGPVLAAVAYGWVVRGRRGR